MENLRALRHEWFGREGLKPEEVEIFHRCCDELEQAINADSRSESAKDAEVTSLKEQLARTERERDQAIEFAGIFYDARLRHLFHSLLAFSANEHCTEYAELYAHLAGKVEG